MKTITKKTLLISGIILLVFVNISAISTIFYHNKTQKEKFIEMERMREEVRVRGMRQFIGDELKLSTEQLNQFKELSRKNMISTHEINQKLNNYRSLMMNEIAKEIPNENTLDNIAKEIGALHYELKKNTIDHFLELKNICNDEQQKDLQKLFMRMINEQDQFNPRRNQGDRRRNSRNQGQNRNRDQRTN